jgi:hypothetical protein
LCFFFQRSSAFVSAFFAKVYFPIVIEFNYGMKTSRCQGLSADKG